MSKYDNPFLIYKDSSPYLYLTEFSGIFAAAATADSGIVIPINPNASDTTTLMSLQFWMRGKLNAGTHSLLSISASGFLLESTIAVDAFGRGKIEYTSTPSTSVKFFQNGKLVINPYVSNDEWTAVSFVFTNGIEFPQSAEIILGEKIVFNNISQYSFSGSATDEQKQFMIDSLSSQYSSSSDLVYDERVGTSLMVIDDISRVQVFSNGVDIFTDVEWQLFEKNVV